MKQILGPLFFASLASVGNLIYVFGQRKSTHFHNPFLLTTLTLIFSIALCIIAYFFMGTKDSVEFVKQNLLWAAISGGGLFLVYIGFYFLYSKYGASYYTLYAVVSILFTSIILGNLILKEKTNPYYYLSLLTACISIFFFGLSKR